MKKMQIFAEFLQKNLQIKNFALPLHSQYSTRLEKGLPILSTIAAVAPMLGFLGTVTGMVQAFWQMSNAGNNIDVSLLSGGIYEAMVTTVGGLIVGIIAIFAYNYLVAQVDKVQNMIEADMIAFLEIVAETGNGFPTHEKVTVKPAGDITNI